MSLCNCCKVMSGELKERIKEIFSTSFMLDCYNSLQLNIYKELFQNPDIKKLMKDEEILYTAKLFMENDLNLSKASKNSYMHRNTMIYRIEKLETLTGLNIKLFEDAIIFDNMLKVYDKIIVEKNKLS